MSEANKETSPKERVVTCWIPCTDWESLPDGAWLVKIDNERKPYHIANVATNTQKSKIIIVGSCFHWDMRSIIAYTAFERYDV